MAGAYPGFNPARQYLSELGGASASRPLIFNAGVFVAGVMAAMAGVGFGLAIVTLTRARLVGALTAAVFLLAGWGLTQAAIYHWPDKRHLAINLALGIQLAPLLLLWGLWARPGVARLKGFLALVFVAMGVLTVLTNFGHLRPAEFGERRERRLVGTRVCDRPRGMGRRRRLRAAALPATSTASDKNSLDSTPLSVV